MNETIIHTNEQKAAEAFSKQSGIFDQLYSGNEIIRYKRKRVRLHVQNFLTLNSKILELNCGTGEDAIWFAQNGYTVHATDISYGMLEKLDQKIKKFQLDRRISYELCSFTGLDRLAEKGPYDCIFSNFAGLNCTEELDKVLASFSPLLKKDGIVTLVLLPEFCLWEFLLLFKGKFKTAFRRFFSSKGKKAHIEGKYFKCWYHNPSFVIHHLKKDFELLNLEGLCTLVPPSYIENFATKYPRAFQFLKSKEDKWKHKWPWRSIGDYYIISLRKTG
jgi:ubiquinone/menaquinone biosynthesis C-methylase UbiE